jgi:hypothetical protein
MIGEKKIPYERRTWKTDDVIKGIHRIHRVEIAKSYLRIIPEALVVALPGLLYSLKTYGAIAGTYFLVRCFDNKRRLEERVI